MLKWRLPVYITHAKIRETGARTGYLGVIGRVRYPPYHGGKKVLVCFVVRTDDLQLEARVSEQRRCAISHRGLGGPVQ